VAGRASRAAWTRGADVANCPGSGGLDPSRGCGQLIGSGGGDPSVADVAGKQPGRLTPTAEAARPSSRSRDPDRCLGHAAAFSACISGPRGPLSRNVT